jgi:hypothetical protein
MAGQEFGRIGRVAYNGFVFPPAISSKVVAEPQYDSAQRAVKYTSYTLSLECVITPGDFPLREKGDGNTVLSADGNLELIRQKLTKPGQRLNFALQGLGYDFKINYSTDNWVNGTVDALFGPKPDLLVWEPLGSNMAVRVVWTCEVHLYAGAEGSSAPFTSHLCEYTYEIGWSINEDGMSVRTINGTLGILGNKQILTTNPGAGEEETNTDESAIIIAQADTHRKQIIDHTPPIPGFLRNQEFNLNRQKNELRWRIQDTEIASDNVYPQYILDMDIEHEASTGFGKSGIFEGKGFITWKSSLSGTIKLAPGAQRNLAWNAFVMVVKDRLQNLEVRNLKAKIEEQTVAQSDNDRENKGAVRKGWYMPVHLGIREKIFRREFHFDFQYLMLCDLAEFWKTSRLFYLLSDTKDGKKTWVQHAASLAVSVTNARGYAELGLCAGNAGAFDLIVDVESYNTNGLLPTICNDRSGNVYDPQAEDPNTDQAIFNRKPPSADQSWVDYQNDIYIEEIPNALQYGRLSAADQSYYQSAYDGQGGYHTVTPSSQGFNILGRTEAPRTTYQHTVQIRGIPQYIITMRGYGIRANYSVPAPPLRQICGQQTTRLGGRWTHKQLVKSSFSPLYCGAWVESYRIPTEVAGKFLTGDALWDGIPAQYA